MFRGSYNHIFRPDADHSSLRHCLTGIQNNAADDLSHLRLVHFGWLCQKNVNSDTWAWSFRPPGKVRNGCGAF